MKSLSLFTLAVAACLGLSSLANAQVILVPHSTTHGHIVPHGNHAHIVPHTTTHLHAVPGMPGPVYPPGQVISNYPSYPSIQPVLVPHTTTHGHLISHGRHLHVVPHTTTHLHQVPVITGPIYP